MLSPPQHPSPRPSLYQSEKAGYSEKYAKSSSAKMLENVGIKSYIDAKMAKIKRPSLK
ncbi:hypothetical protein E2P74_08425 [Limosilactobacillus fermentum]|nr:hypothetical protein E2P74_08425 [Limosilactobacillus fermentum]